MDIEAIKKFATGESIPIINRNELISLGLKEFLKDKPSSRISMMLKSAASQGKEKQPYLLECRCSSCEKTFIVECDSSGLLLNRIKDDVLMCPECRKAEEERQAAEYEEQQKKKQIEVEKRDKINKQLTEAVLNEYFVQATNDVTAEDFDDMKKRIMLLDKKCRDKIADAVKSNISAGTLYDSKYWHLIRAALERIAKPRCILSGAEEDLQMVHISYDSIGREYEMLIDLCFVSNSLIRENGIGFITKYVNDMLKKKKSDYFFNQPHHPSDVFVRGKYKGRTVAEILKEDPQYLIFFKNNNAGFDVVDDNGRSLLYNIRRY